VVHKLYEIDHDARLNFVNWYLEIVHDAAFSGEISFNKGNTWTSRIPSSCLYRASTVL